MSDNRKNIREVYEHTDFYMGQYTKINYQQIYTCHISVKTHAHTYLSFACVKNRCELV